MPTAVSGGDTLPESRTMRPLRAVWTAQTSHRPHLPLLSRLARAISDLRWGSRSAVVLGVGCDMAQASIGDSVSEVKFLTVAEVAASMRVSKMTVYRLVHAGDLPAARVGRSFRVPENAVNEYLRKSYFQAG